MTGSADWTPRLISLWLLYRSALNGSYKNPLVLLSCIQNRALTSFQLKRETQPERSWGFSVCEASNFHSKGYYNFSFVFPTFCCCWVFFCFVLGLSFFLVVGFFLIPRVIYSFSQVASSELCSFQVNNTFTGFLRTFTFTSACRDACIFKSTFLPSAELNRSLTCTLLVFHTCLFLCNYLFLPHRAICK